MHHSHFIRRKTCQCTGCFFTAPHKHLGRTGNTRLLTQSLWRRLLWGDPINYLLGIYQIAKVDFLVLYKGPVIFTFKGGGSKKYPVSNPPYVKICSQLEHACAHGCCFSLCSTKTKYDPHIVSFW